jgi:hypothetical protein
MKYRVYASSCWYEERTLDEYPCLKDFGLEIMKDGNDSSLYIVLNTIEELMRLIESVGFSVIVHHAIDDDGEPSIEIYDDWRE